MTEGISILYPHEMIVCIVYIPYVTKYLKVDIYSPCIKTGCKTLYSLIRKLCRKLYVNGRDNYESRFMDAIC